MHRESYKAHVYIGRRFPSSWHRTTNEIMRRVGTGQLRMVPREWSGHVVHSPVRFRPSCRATIQMWLLWTVIAGLYTWLRSA